MADVRGDDGPAARDLVADEFSRQAFAHRDELHLGRDLAFARVVKLRDGARGFSRAGRSGRLRPSVNPWLTQLRQADGHVVALRTTGIVHAER